MNSLKAVGGEELSEIAKKPLYFSYIYSNKTSLQKLQPVDEIVVDTVNTEAYGRIFQRIDSLINPSNLFHFKNFKENVYRLDFKQRGRDISIRDQIPEYQWTLEEGNKTIAGYSCKKATTTTTKYGRKQNYVAWYWEEIPIGDGIMGFNGLPGLILQIELNDEMRTTFEKILIAPNEAITIPEPPKAANSLLIKEYEKMMMGNR